ncbi:PiggyBac transposable element-derived protein [Cinara cedri]|uniref:PiggyBac transposable element-derived protein n=1 Tax=Cinara cedri TaxID=506608 RepID=A0A5E4MZU1_9HEMI|nr:PiggyBac transposable element-derived protein [Cinara cedri]
MPNSGVYKSGRTNVDEFWQRQRDSTGLDIFWITMSLQRFRFLVQSIRFDDKGTRNDRIKFDKLAPIRFIFDSFILNCKTHYLLGEYVSLDEKLIAFRGRCSFSMYIPSKPAKYGIKVFNLCDARAAYTYNLEVYLGEQPDGPYKFSNKPEDVVKRLCGLVVTIWQFQC